MTITADEISKSRGVTIAQALSRPYDNFGVIRLLLSIFVVVSHTMSIGLTGLASSEPGYSWTGLTLGEHSVNCFFAISGFLIAMSWDRRRNAMFFATSRFLRLVPGLVAAVLISTFVIGAFMTTLPLTAYVASRETWQFVLEAILRLKSTGTLPGVFRDNPLDIVLGTVWSLKYEIGCYFGLLLLGVTGLLLRPRVILAIAVIFGLSLLAIEFFALKLSLSQITAFRLRFIFASAAALYVWRDRIPVSLPVALLSFSVALMLRGTPVYHTALYAAETYLVLCLAIAPGLSSPKLELPFDFSYGIYLYGLPVQQALTSLYHPANPYLLFPLALLVTTLFAAFSWYCIEHPALALKKHVLARTDAWRLPFTRPKASDV